MGAPRFCQDRSWRGRVRSFQDAGRGLKILLGTQWNARFHAVATAGAAGAGWWWQISAGEWCALVLSIGLVWVAEALNTAIESAVDLASPELDPLAGRAKDLAAGGVLAAAITALAVGGFVFGPRLLALLAV